MITDVTEKTVEFLRACKEAGYERVTIFVTDKRVPDSVEIKKTGQGAYWGYGTVSFPYKVVCGDPATKGPHPTLNGKKWPAMWGIVKRLKLNHAGGGNRDGHDIGEHITKEGDLTAGYYDLAELAGN